MSGRLMVLLCLLIGLLAACGACGDTAGRPDASALPVDRAGGEPLQDGTAGAEAPEGPATMSKDADPQPSLLLLPVGRAVPPDRIPDFLRERLSKGPPTMTVEEFRRLDQPRRDALLAVLVEAHGYYESRSRQRRAGANPDERTAKAIGAFLAEVRRN